MGAKVYLHVGAPKTGTTYLQDRLFLNRTQLAKHGVKYPVGARESMFFPAIDLTGIKWPGFHEKAQGEWDGLVRRVKLATGTVIVSHEILSVAKRSRVARVARDLDDTELHVIYSARDVARQLTADWQEGLKMYGTKSFRRFLEEIHEDDPMTSKIWFWRAQHLPRVLANWGAIVPPERFHLMVAPRSGGDLWAAFCRVIGADPAWGPADIDRRNPSLGRGEATLLRRLNKRLWAAGIERDDYRRAVLYPVIYDALSVRPDMQRVTLPPDLLPWADDLAQQWIDAATGAGIDVVGDLADLRPLPQRGEWLDPDKPKPREINDAALDALVGAIGRIVELPDPEATLGRKLTRVAQRIARRPGR